MMNPEVTMTNIDHASRSTVGAFLRTNMFESLLAKQSRVPGARKIARLGAGWVVGRPGTTKNGARNTLPLPTKALQSKEACAKQHFENILEKAT